MTHKSFNFTQADVALDTQDYKQTKEATQSKVYKGTIYKDYGELGKMCIYNKYAKDKAINAKNLTPYGTYRL